MVKELKPVHRDPMTWLALALIAPVLIWVLISLIGPQTLQGMNKQDWAAWVQALGSIAAILVSACVVVWQVGKQHRLEVEHVRRTATVEELRRLEGYRDVAHLGYAQLANAMGALDTAERASEFQSTRRYSSNYDLIDETLQATDANAMSSADLVLATRAVRVAYREALREFDSAFLFEGIAESELRSSARGRMSRHISSLGNNLSALERRAADLRRDLKLPMLPWHARAAQWSGGRRVRGNTYD